MTHLFLRWRTPRWPRWPSIPTPPSRNSMCYPFCLLGLDDEVWPGRNQQFSLPISNVKEFTVDEPSFRWPPQFFPWYFTWSSLFVNNHTHARTDALVSSKIQWKVWKMARARAVKKRLHLKTTGPRMKRRCHRPPPPFTYFPLRDFLSFHLPATPLSFLPVSHQPQTKKGGSPQGGLTPSHRYRVGR